MDADLTLRTGSGGEVREVSLHLSDAFRARFELQAELGRGGMGVVFLALDAGGGRVAIKFLMVGAGADQVLRFMREGEVQGRLAHPQVVTLHEMGLEGDVPYLVMEHLPGGSLKSLIERGPLAGPLALGVALDVLAGLEAIHAAGIVHRDIKPGNVLLEGTGRAKICDLGLAQVLEAHERLTQTGLVVGTPLYYAPEQARGEVTGPPTDVYAMGVVLHEMLAGEAPFRGRSMPELLAKHCSAPPPRLEDCGRGVPTDVAEAVRAALAKDARDRPTASELAQTLRSSSLRKRNTRSAQAASRAGTRRVPGVDSPAASPPAAHGAAPSAGPSARVRAALAVALLLGALLAAAFVAFGPRHAVPSPPPAPSASVAALAALSDDEYRLAMSGLEGILARRRRTMGELVTSVGQVPGRFSFLLPTEMALPLQADIVWLDTFDAMARTRFARGAGPRERMLHSRVLASHVTLLCLMHDAFQRNLLRPEDIAPGMTERFHGCVGRADLAVLFELFDAIGPAVDAVREDQSQTTTVASHYEQLVNVARAVTAVQWCPELVPLREARTAQFRAALDRGGPAYRLARVAWDRGVHPQIIPNFKRARAEALPLVEQTGWPAAVRAALLAAAFAER